VALYEVTRRCNLNCMHCMNSSGPGYSSDELSTEEALNLINSLARSKVPFVFWSGGEPLLRDDLLLLIEHATSLCMGSALVTNGTLITSDVARRIKTSGVFKVEVNLDSHREDIYDWFRGKAGSFRDTLRGIEALRNCEIATRANLVLTRLNIHSIADIVKLAQSVGLNELAILPFVPAGRGLSHREELEPTEDEVAAEKATWLELQRELGQSFLLAFEGNNLVCEQLDPLSIFPGCGAGRVHCCITPNGSVKPCPAFRDSLIAGTIRTESVQSIWERGEIFRALRRQDIEVCRSCQHKSCSGGCRLRAYQEYGSFVGGPDPRCTYQATRKEAQANVPAWS
ncbi:MAG: radical SAM protein, partial [Bacillota bacterium]